MCFDMALSEMQISMNLSLLCRFVGGLKEVRVKKEFYVDPTRILFRAVSGMLPKNKLRQVSLPDGRNLEMYGRAHPQIFRSSAIPKSAHHVHSHHLNSLLSNSAVRQ